MIAHLIGIIIAITLGYYYGKYEATQQAVHTLKKLKEEINDIIKANKNNNSVYWEGNPKLLYDINKSILVQQHNLADGTKIMEKIREIEY